MVLGPPAPFSHDIHTPVNIQVLKKQGLLNFNEAQLRVLLLQNDPCLLPEVSHQAKVGEEHQMFACPGQPEGKGASGTVVTSWTLVLLGFDTL